MVQLFHGTAVGIAGMGAGTLGLGIIHPLHLGHDTSNSLVTTGPRAVEITTDIALAMETTTDITIIMDTTFIDQAKYVNPIYL